MAVTVILIAAIVAMSAAKAYLLWRWSFLAGGQQEQGQEQGQEQQKEQNV